MSMTQLLFSFQGRLNRKPYWLTNIAVGVVVILLVILAVVMFGEREFAAFGLTMALLVILYIPLIWVSLALGAKRLHDRDKSAWWLVLFYAVPGILGSLAMFFLWVVLSLKAWQGERLELPLFGFLAERLS